MWREMHLNGHDAIHEDRYRAWVGAPLACNVLHGPLGWNWLGTTGGAWRWPGSCRSDCWPSGAGLTAGISTAMHRPAHDPDHDRGQVLVDPGLVQVPGDFQALGAPGAVARPGVIDTDRMAVPGRGRRTAGGPHPPSGVPVPSPVVGDAGGPVRGVSPAAGRWSGTDRGRGDRPGRLGRADVQ